MANQGGKRSTTWKPGENPVKKKGMLHKSTKIKETLGPKGWDRFKSHMETDGADKLVEEMNKLKGKDYTLAYSMMAEYVKPKLQRVTLAGDQNNPLHVHQATVDVNQLDAETAKKLLDALTPNSPKPPADSPTEG